MSSMNVSLPESLRDFAEARAARGYSSVSEYIRALLRQDQKRVVEERAEKALIRKLEEREVDPEVVKEAIAGLFRLRRDTTLGPDLTGRDLIDEGRR